MATGYSSTSFIHDINVQKEFERVAKSINSIIEELPQPEKQKEQKKEPPYAVTVLHNNELKPEAKKVQILNFVDNENVKFEIESLKTNNQTYTSIENATQVNINAVVNIETCFNDLVSQMNLIRSQRPVMPIINIPKPIPPKCLVIKCDNPTNGDGLVKSSDTVNMIDSMSFTPYPSLPTTGSPMYQANFIRGIRYHNQCFKNELDDMDNTEGYTKIIAKEKGIYRVSAVFTGQYDNGNTMEVHTHGNSATLPGETIVELMVMKNGIYNSLLNAMRVANQSVHLQGQDLVYCDVNDEISLGFKAYEYTLTNQREIRLIWGEPTAPYIPLYSHFIVEKVCDAEITQSNSINTYIGEYL